MTRILLIASLLSTLAGCGLPGLGEEELYGVKTPTRKVASLEGLVRDATSSAALAGASISVGGKAAISGAAGDYRLEGFDVGVAYDGSVTREGYKPTTFSVALKEGQNQLDLALLVLPCSQTGCSANQFCSASTGRCESGAGVARLDGGVFDSCTGAAIAARVTISGASTCSFGGKAYYQLTGLPAGGPQSIAAGKQGYKPYLETITLAAGFNNHTIRLERNDGCGVPVTDVPCSCTQAQCQP